MFYTKDAERAVIRYYEHFHAMRDFKYDIKNYINPKAHVFELYYEADLTAQEWEKFAELLVADEYVGVYKIGDEYVVNITNIEGTMIAMMPGDRLDKKYYEER